MEIQIEKTLFLERFKDINDIEIVKMLNQFLDYALSQKKEDNRNLPEYMPDFHKQILNSRLLDMKENPEAEVTWEKIHEYLKFGK